jgi:hypothetical protein
MSSTTAYSSHATNWPVLAVAVGLALPVVALSQPDLAQLTTRQSLGPVLVVLAVVVVGALTATSLRVTVGVDGVVARFGALGAPTFRYGVDQIASAGAVTISPWATPGVFWTHRDGMRLALHGGPGLRLVLRSGRRVTIGVDNAAAALAALADSGVTIADRGSTTD